NAGKGELFVAAYAREGRDLRTLHAPELAQPDAAVRAIAALGLTSATLCGSAAAPHAAPFATALGFAPALAQDSDAPQGRYVAEAGRLSFLAHGASDLARLEPNYLRGSDAKLPEVKLAV